MKNKARKKKENQEIEAKLVADGENKTKEDD